MRRGDTESYRVANKQEVTEDPRRQSSGESVSTIVADKDDTSHSPDEEAVSIAGDQRAESTVPDTVLEKESRISIDSSSAGVETKDTKSQEGAEWTKEPDLIEEAKDALGMIYYALYGP